MASAGIQNQNEALLESFEAEYSIIAAQNSMNGEHNIEPINRDSDAEELHARSMSTTSDISLEEMHKYVAYVCEENLSLKKSLEQSTKMLEQHLAKAISWQTEKTTLHLNLKKHNEKIDELETQNSQLQSKIKEIESQLKKDVSPFSEEEAGFEMVNKKELKIDLEKNSENEVFKEVTRDKGQDDTKSESDAAIEQLKKQIEILEHSLTGKLLELEEEKTSHSETKKTLNTVQTNYDRVTQLLQVQSKDEREKKSVRVDHEMDNRQYLEQIDGLTAQLLATEDKLQDQEMKVKSMATELESMKGGSENMPNLKDENFVDVEREMDTKMYLDKIDALSAQLMTTEMKLQEEEFKVKAMTTELNSMKEDSESVPILKSQIEVYESDLNSALLARDAAVEEVSRLTMQIHDKTSTASVSLCDSCGGNISMISGSSRGNAKHSVGHKHRKPELIQRDNMFVCPVCKVMFTCLQAVENHIDDCLDKSEREKH